MKSRLICHDIEHNQHEVPAGRLSWRPSVYGVLIEGDRVLLSPQRDGYDFPGGGVNIDETLEEALIREFWEETGLKVRPLHALHVSSSFFATSEYAGREREYWNCPIIFFLVEKVSGELSLDNAEDYEKKFMKLAAWLDIGGLAGRKFRNFLGNESVAVIELAVRLIKNKAYEKE